LWQSIWASLRNDEFNHLVNDSGHQFFFCVLSILLLHPKHAAKMFAGEWILTWLSSLDINSSSDNALSLFRLDILLSMSTYGRRSNKNLLRLVPRQTRIFVYSVHGLIFNSNHRLALTLAMLIQIWSIPFSSKSLVLRLMKLSWGKPRSPFNPSYYLLKKQNINVYNRTWPITKMKT